MENSNTFADRHNPNTHAYRRSRRQTLQFHRSKPHDHQHTLRPQPKKEAEFLKGIVKRKQEEMLQMREEQIAEREFFEMERLAYVEALDELQVQLSSSKGEGAEVQVESTSEEPGLAFKAELDKERVEEKHEALNRAFMADEDNLVLAMEKRRLAEVSTGHERTVEQLTQELQQSHRQCDLLETRSCVAEEKGLELQEEIQSLQATIDESKAESLRLSVNCNELEKQQDETLERSRQEEAKTRALEAQLHTAQETASKAESKYAEACEDNTKLRLQIEEVESQFRLSKAAAEEQRSGVESRVIHLEEKNRSLVEAEMLQRKYMVRLSERLASASAT